MEKIINIARGPNQANKYIAVIAAETKSAIIAIPFKNNNTASINSPDTFLPIESPLLTITFSHRSTFFVGLRFNTLGWLNILLFQFCSTGIFHATHRRLNRAMKKPSRAKIPPPISTMVQGVNRPVVRRAIMRFLSEVQKKTKTPITTNAIPNKNAVLFISTFSLSLMLPFFPYSYNLSDWPSLFQYK